MIQFENDIIIASNDQQCRRAHQFERGVSKIGAPAPRYDGLDPVAEPRGRDESRGGSGAGAEQAKRQPAERGVLIDPMDRVYQTISQQPNIEHVTAIDLLVGHEKVKQKGPEACVIQCGGDRCVARAETAGAASMRKYDEPV
ncbi:protein of unknown function (plasmid) [Methylocella tundrae]|uniref:Uncharacterized protein n=1 Tax=Methylocella tundrae TaxID=227605 RepID=A0A4U8Z6W8_METTU|nr:protein of unknown function [Methylocella tundrae]